MKVLVTGTDGFIGFHLAAKLVELGQDVAGVDNIIDYYSTVLKMNGLHKAGISNEAAN